MTTATEADAKRLHKPAKAVKNHQATEIIIGIQAMKQIAREWEAKNGLCDGLAAPQIGLPYRIVILRKNDFMAPVNPDLIQDRYANEDEYRAAYALYREFQRAFGHTYDPWHVLINPTILSEEGSQWSVEGCLSVPGSAYRVLRPELVFFRYTDAKGRRTPPMAVRGDSAVKLRHEIDHTLGITIDQVASEVYIGEKGVTL